MKMKKLFSALCAASVMLSSAGGSALLMSSNAIAEEPGAVGTEEVTTLAAPQNVRVEEGSVVWDKVEDAYGYNVRFETDSEYVLTYYVCEAEVDRLCYENNVDFGEYTFEVRAFLEDGTISEWSEPVTAVYAPTLTAPSNVRLDEENEETVLWDDVAGAFRYNVRFYNDDSDRTLYTNGYIYGASISYYWHLGESGDYWLSIQTMDQDYNVSEWTEPIKVSHTLKAMLDTPQNVRFDETGENVLWDEVAGADYYEVCLTSNNDTDGNYNWKYSWQYPQQTELKNWRAYVFPAADEYHISVCARNSADGNSSNSSEELTAPNKFTLDSTVKLPETLTAKSDAVSFDTDSSVNAYWMEICIDGKPLENENNYWFISDCHWDTEGYSTEMSNYISYRYPEGNYDIKLYAVNGNNYSVKTYPVTLDTPHDTAVWVPEVFYKHDVLLWDYDRVRHDTTGEFWVRVKNVKDGGVVELNRTWSENYYGLTDMSNGEYTFEACAYDYNIGKLGPWSTPLEILKHEGGLFDKENETTTEVETPPEAADIPTEDRVTSITINPAFNMKHKDGDDVELDLTKIKIKAKEIYDEEGLKRASEALGETISGNKHYNLLDLTLLYNEEDFSNGYEGLVQVVIPIPTGHRDKTFSCYRLTEVNGKMTKELIPGEQTEDSFIIYLEHFSEYALVGDGGEEEHTHTYGEWVSDNEKHWKECECGNKTESAAHIFGEWKVTKEATESEEGSRERACETCGYKQTEALAKLTPSTPDEPSVPDEPSKPSTPSDSSTPSSEDKKPAKFKDSETKIEITAPVDAFENADVKFNATPIAEQTKNGQYAYDLTFTDKSGNKVQPKVAVTVKIPVPGELKDKTIYIYHVEADNTYTEVDHKIENDMAVFTASEFSIYIITSEKLNSNNNDSHLEASSAPETSETNPGTNTNPSTGIAVMSLLPAALAGVAVVICKKKK